MNVAVVGLDTEGLKVAVDRASNGQTVLAIDFDPDKIEILKNGFSYSKELPTAKIQDLMSAGWLHASDQISSVQNADEIVICIPVFARHDGDLEFNYVLSQCREMVRYARHDTTITLSNHYPARIVAQIEAIFRRKCRTRIEIQHDEPAFAQVC